MKLVNAFVVDFVRNDWADGHLLLLAVTSNFRRDNAVLPLRPTHRLPTSCCPSPQASTLASGLRGVSNELECESKFGATGGTSPCSFLATEEE